MKINYLFRGNRFLILACLSGFLLALSFPRFDFSACAWLALIPLFLVIDEKPFAGGFWTGFCFFAAALYWVNIVMTTYGGMNLFFSFAAYLMLCVYLALYFGAATWSAWRLRKAFGLPYWLSLPFLWVAAEYLRSFLFSGFPWVNLGYSQYRHLLMIQSADLFGVYSLTFLIILVNAGLAHFYAVIRNRSLRMQDGLVVAVLIGCFSANVFYGIYRLEQSPDVREKSIHAVVVQGNIDQSIKWDPAYQKATLERYQRLSEEAVAKERADLVIWPESAAPFYFNEGEELSDMVRGIPGKIDAELLFGAPAYEISNRRARYLNSAFLMSKAGKELGRSDKIHLVPFGEYNPFGRFFPFLEKMVAGIGDFSPGTIKPLPFEKGKAGVLICFEAIFPEIARNYTRKGCDLLVNITNDAWFGHSSAPFQHLSMTLFRAVENRVWIARAANTGISAFIAPSGRVVSQTGIFKTLSLSAEIGLGSRATLYNRIGDAVPAVFLLLSGLAIFTAQFRLYRKKEQAR
ncbi:MAG: apolipoprotein N-acyltransferase [Deltaproteobacteria bacterium]|nr:apolipoprotein N-acyltransferase [Deltaproteobacteria bacterium]